MVPGAVHSQTGNCHVAALLIQPTDCLCLTGVASESCPMDNDVNNYVP